MEEKKIPDEEIVKDIERSTGMPSYWKKIVLDLIRRLQYGYSSASKASEEWKAKYEEELKENVELKKQVNECNRDCEKYAIENGELQQQVDELKAKRVIECYGMLKDCDIVNQAVKDKAKEICLKIIKDQPQPIKEKWVEWFKKEYGVEVK